MVALVLTSFSCKKHPFSTDLVGTWVSDTTELKVRTRDGFLSYTFTPITVDLRLEIDAEARVSGRFGSLSFEDLELVGNRGNVERKGIAYILDLGETGTLTPDDPADDKRIELWIRPLESDQAATMSIEVRQMFALDAVPMGDVEMRKQ